MVAAAAAAAVAVVDIEWTTITMKMKTIDDEKSADDAVDHVAVAASIEFDGILGALSVHILIVAHH